MRMRKWLPRLALLGLVILLITGVVGAIAGANTVPVTHADDETFAIDQSQLYPPQCAGMTFSNVITGSGSISGGPGNDLIYGSDGDDDIRGGNGDDCIIAGAGNDNINGQNGDDVIDGGSGYDVIRGGPGTDTCLNGEDVNGCEN